MPWVDVNLDDVDTDDLISELEDRHLDIHEQFALLELIKNSQLSDEPPKLKLFLSIMDKYSYLELHDMLIINSPAKAGLNQIPLIQ